MKIEFTKKPKNVTIIEGFPGIGLIGTIVTEFLIDHLDAEKIGTIWFDDLAPILAIHDGKVLDPLAVYYSKKYNLVIFHALTQVAGMEWKIADALNKVAKELSDMKDTFVSVVSHELRTPLTSMKLYSKLLNKGKFGKLNVKQKKAIGVISDETDRLSELINDMLNLSKLESKKDPLKITSFDFYKFSKNHHVYGLANEKGIKVKIEVPKRFLLRVDVEKFKQVFINLLSNAIKFTEKKGIITVIARDELNFWEITIKDTGSGIPAEQVPKLFDKFFQVENYMTRYQGGTGLGLAIVKKIIDLHGGEIKVESEIGKGSSFIISIPKKIK